MDSEDSVKVLDMLCDYYGIVPGDDSDSYIGMTPFQILILTIISQQTTERNTRKACESLFSRFPDSRSLSVADPNEVEVLIHSSGYYRQKTKAVIEVSKIIESEFEGVVPDNMDSLLALPMVGRKTASCVMRYAFGRPSVIVDTHINRVSNRLGISDSKRTCDTERCIIEKIPTSRWDDLDRCFMSLGRDICKAKKMECDRCPVSGLCDHIC